MADHALRLSNPRQIITVEMIIQAAETVRTTRVLRTPRRHRRHRRSLWREALATFRSAILAAPEAAFAIAAVAACLGSTIGASL